MKAKQLLERFCSTLEENLNMTNHNRRSVTLFSGIKPTGYFIPQIHVGTSKSIPKEISMSWFVEIRIDDTVIFRESHVIDKEPDLKLIEDIVCTRLLESTFHYGVISSANFIE